MLYEFDKFPIRYEGSEHEKERTVHNEKHGEVTIKTNWYYDQKFFNGELRLLIDSVLAADGLSKQERDRLIKSIEGLSSKHFHSVTKKIDMDIYGKIENRNIYLTLENIGNAIADGRQISFHYCDCDINGKLKEKRDSKGKKKLYTVNPYQIVSRNGHSYLICNIPEHDDLTHFRIDRIKDSVIKDEPLIQLRTLKGFEAGIKLSDYVKTHPNLWSGTPVHVTFQCKQYMMNDVADSFGTNNRIEELPDDMMRVHVEASEASMLHWAVQFADDVEVISPKSLRKKIAETLRSALDKYENE
jgi:predicted DNA-binding transcriptional regulator YafY